MQEQTCLQIDQPDPRGGTTSTGNVARRPFSDESNFIECALSLIEVQYRPIVHSIHSQLAAILRIFNSDRKVNKEKLGSLCQDTYLLIMDTFPWVGVTPSLHKLLAHSEELIRECNSGCGLKSFSEEGVESG